MSFENIYEEELRCLAYSNNHHNIGEIREVKLILQAVGDIEKGFNNNLYGGN